MINLKLAEYDRKTAKFKRFLELDRIEDEDENNPTFGYFKDYVKIYWYDYPVLHSEFKQDIFELDQKDPLNRFNGLFDGRTYGEGRFVLIQNDEDSYATNYLCMKPFKAEIAGEVIDTSQIKEVEIYAGKINIHQNPEFYEKLK